MAQSTTYDAVTPAAFETELRAKIRDVLTTLNELEAQASPVTVTIEGIPVTVSWGTRDVQINIADGTYILVMPLAWITSA